MDLTRPVTLAEVKAHADAQRHGAGEQPAAFGAARVAAGMGYCLQAWRPRQAAGVQLMGSLRQQRGKSCRSPSTISPSSSPPSLHSALVRSGTWSCRSRGCARVGKTEEEMKARGSAMPFVIAIIALLLMSWMLAGLMGHLAQITVRGGVMTAFFVWVGFVVTTMAVEPGLRRRQAHAHGDRRPLLACRARGHGRGYRRVRHAGHMRQ